ncbi:MAG: CotH kinase family protein, partial [Gemmataceae bacterium]
MNFIGLVLLFCLPGQVNAHDAFFAGPIPELRFVIAPAEEASLRREPRKYVRAQFIENQGKGVEVGIKIKGAAGSTRPYDDKPALTINMDRYHREQSFHGMDKFHLNNSVQDETYLHEKIGFALSSAAKVPASRVTHARVRINNRDLGLFVLKEGFDTTFLKNYYPDNKGNLYDGGFLQDIDANLQLDIGPGPEDQRDLKALLAACREGDLVKRKIAVEKVLNVDEMISFMAVELMSGHWDGYARNRNNYRIYFNPRSQKAIFLPHGMDQLFADFSAMELPGAIVAAAVMNDPQSRRLYRRRVEALLPLFEPKAMELVIDPVLKRLKPVVDSLGKDFANRHAQAVNGLRERIKGRYLALVESVKRRDPGPIVFGPEGFEPIRD